MIKQAAFEMIRTGLWVLLVICVGYLIIKSLLSFFNKNDEELKGQLELTIFDETDIIMMLMIFLVTCCEMQNILIINKLAYFVYAVYTCVTAAYICFSTLTDSKTGKLYDIVSIVMFIVNIVVASIIVKPIWKVDYYIIKCDISMLTVIVLLGILILGVTKLMGFGDTLIYFNLFLCLVIEDAVLNTQWSTYILVGVILLSSITFLIECYTHKVKATEHKPYTKHIIWGFIITRLAVEVATIITYFGRTIG